MSGESSDQSPHRLSKDSRANSRPSRTVRGKREVGSARRNSQVRGTARRRSAGEGMSRASGSSLWSVRYSIDQRQHSPNQRMPWATPSNWLMACWMRSMSLAAAGGRSARSWSTVGWLNRASQARRSYVFATAIVTLSSSSSSPWLSRDGHGVGRLAMLGFVPRLVLRRRGLCEEDSMVRRVGPREQPRWGCGEGALETLIGQIGPCDGAR